MQDSRGRRGHGSYTGALPAQQSCFTLTGTDPTRLATLFTQGGPLHPCLTRVVAWRVSAICAPDRIGRKVALIC
jgi:hypothetical protein